MRTLFKWTLRLFYLVVGLIIFGFLIGMGFVFYDEFKIKNKAAELKEDLGSEIQFADFLRKHPNFTLLTLKKESSETCLSIDQWGKGAYVLGREKKISFSQVLTSIEQKVRSTDCRLFEILYFNRTRGLWRVSISFIIDGEGRAKELRSVNIYR